MVAFWSTEDQKKNVYKLVKVMFKVITLENKFCDFEIKKKKNYQTQVLKFYLDFFFL